MLKTSAMYFIKVFLILAIILLQNVAAVIVKVEQGRLRGEQKKTITGDTLYYSFKGIPYAAPPIGELRFKDPQPALSWKGIRNATEHGNVCPQFDFFRNGLPCGNEDCLYLNVYTPLKRDSLLPVIFFIHGGNFEWGSGNDDIYGPDFLMYGSKVVLVTINYRLDNLGLLCLHSPEVPGNAAMKDQVAALRWVKQNIEHFGGDPSKVTIFGESVGSMSVTFHTLSPMSRGLYRRAIALSGVALSEFMVPFEPQRRAIVLAKKLGFKAKTTTTNTTALLKFLQSVPAVQLINIETPVIAAEEYIVDPLLLYSVPVVEKDFGQERFLIEPPEVSLDKGQSNVDIILGFTSAEGVFFIPILENSSVIEKSDKYPEGLTPRDILYRSTPEIDLKLADLIIQHYTGSKLMSLKTIPQFANRVGDAFVYSVIAYANLLSKLSKNNIYLYEFTSMSERNIYNELRLRYGLTGVAHFEDIMYVFQPKLFNLPVNKNATSYKMIRQMCALLINFAVHGNPTPDASLGVIWPTYNTDSQVFIDIGEHLTLKANPRRSTVDFYEFIYEKAAFN